MRYIIFRHPEMLSVEDFYLRYNFSKGFIAPHGMAHQQLVAALSRGFADIEAHEDRRFDFEVTAGRFEIVESLGAIDPGEAMVPSAAEFSRGPMA